MTNLHFLPSTRTALLVLALFASMLFAPSAQGQGNVEQKSLDRAHAFLKTANRGRDVMSYVHFGARYTGHTYQQRQGVQNKPGDFALIYRYTWDNDGITDIAFLCDSKGYVYEAQIDFTNAVVQQPYALANLSINVVGNLVLEAFRNQMNQDELKQARRMIDNPNARGLMEMSLKLQQAFGQ